MNINNDYKNKLCLVQMHYTDITENLENYNAVEKIINSNIFDNIVIAAADIKENEFLKDYADLWNIKICFGSVEKVTDRIFQISNEFSADIVLRVLPNWYFIDIDLIRRMIKKIEMDHIDYLKLPNNFDIRFGGDIFSFNFIDYIKTIFDKDSSISNKYNFNPWGYADIYGNELDLKIFEFKDIPSYSNLKFKNFKKTYNNIWPEHWDTADSPQFPYQLASKYIKNNFSKALDIASGFGAGSSTLLQNGAKNVIGVDISKKSVEHSKQKYKNQNGLSFIVGDALNIEFQKYSFDLVVSIHTMEHVVNDNLFLSNLKYWMKKDAIIVLEVPLLMKYPFSGSNEPYGKYHIREYIIEDLVELFSKYFSIIDSYGVTRGFYANKQFARNAYLLVGKNIT
jgi:ubiquinone/menaquinone biosynthesis C-methylase UbiE